MRCNINFNSSDWNSTKSSHLFSFTTLRTLQRPKLTETPSYRFFLPSQHRNRPKHQAIDSFCLSQRLKLTETQSYWLLPPCKYEIPLSHRLSNFWHSFYLFMNNTVTTTEDINRRIHYSRGLFRNYFWPLPSHITSSRNLRNHCIVIGEAEGQRERFVFDFSEEGLVRVYIDNRNPEVIYL